MEIVLCSVDRENKQKPVKELCRNRLNWFLFLPIGYTIKVRLVLSTGWLDLLVYRGSDYDVVMSSYIRAVTRDAG